MTLAAAIWTRNCSTTQGPMPPLCMSKRSMTCVLAERQRIEPRLEGAECVSSIRIPVPLLRSAVGVAHEHAIPDGRNRDREVAPVARDRAARDDPNRRAED